MPPVESIRHRGWLIGGDRRCFHLRALKLGGTETDRMLSAPIKFLGVAISQTQKLTLRLSMDSALAQRRSLPPLTES
jgi:hypothetical protein